LEVFEDSAAIVAIIEGPLTLFAARGNINYKALFAPTDLDHDWGSLSRARVDIKIVDDGPLRCAQILLLIGSL
jgi:hypothetical protein